MVRETERHRGRLCSQTTVNRNHRDRRSFPHRERLASSAVATRARHGLGAVAVGAMPAAARRFVPVEARTVHRFRSSAPAHNAGAAIERVASRRHDGSQPTPLRRCPRPWVEPRREREVCALLASARQSRHPTRAASTRWLEAARPYRLLLTRRLQRGARACFWRRRRLVRLTKNFSMYPPTALGVR